MFESWSDPESRGQESVDELDALKGNRGGGWWGGEHNDSDSYTA